MYVYVHRFKPKLPTNLSVYNIYFTVLELSTLYYRISFIEYELVKHSTESSELQNLK